MEELFQMVLPIFITIMIMKAVKIWTYIIYITLHLLEISICFDVFTTNYESINFYL